MNKEQLRVFIKLVLNENDNIRISTQLLSPDDVKQQNKGNQNIKVKDNRIDGNEETEQNGVKEFCAAGGGAIVGMTGPITGPFTGVPSTKKKKHKRKKH